MGVKYDRCVGKVSKSLKKNKRKGNAWAICMARIKMVKKIRIKGYTRKVKGKRIRVKGYTRKK